LTMVGTALPRSVPCSRSSSCSSRLAASSWAADSGVDLHQQQTSRRQE
jgi:hypothetical protein